MGRARVIRNRAEFRSAYSADRSVARCRGTFVLSPPYSPTTASVQAWVAAGGVASDAVLEAMDALVTSLGSLTSKTGALLLLLEGPSDLASVMRPLINQASVTPANVNFVGVGTDYVVSGASRGLTGNGSTKYINFGWNLTSLSLTAFTYAVLAHDGDARNVEEGGAIEGVSTRWRYSVNNSTISGGPGMWSDIYDSTSGRKVSAVSGGDAAGVACVSTVATTTTHYDNGTSIGTNTVSGSRPNLPAFGYAYNLAGTPGAFSTRRLGALWLSDGLSGAEVTTLTDALNAYDATIASL